MRKGYWITGIIIVSLLMSACVPSSQFNALKEETDNKIEELKQENLALETENNELEYALKTRTEKLDDLKDDTLAMGRELRDLKKSHQQVQDEYEMLSQQHKALKSGKTSEMKALLAELQTLKDDLLEREDRLNAMAKDLEKKEKRLNEMEQDIMQKEARMAEMESVLNRQDSLVTALKDKVSAALLNFEGEGLTVEQKDGKVYLSLEEKLLFSSGSWTVESRGRQAIKQIAQVLEKNPDIHIMVEGHTDNVPYNGSGQVKDNWDLSVKRATSIVRIITQSSDVNPSQLTAAGRGEYLPVASNETAKGKARNRRTEIILTPDLSELYDIIDSDNQN
ncbi:MAG: OmpA family protein [Bacteroidota bacterium]